MKKIGIITFHAAHNYGSMLQNYALQRAIVNIVPNVCVETINMRSLRQTEQYDFFMAPWKYHDKRRILLSLFYLPFRKDLVKKHELFESFLREKVCLSVPYEELPEDAISSGYDAIIAGSDQIWNITAYDFSWNYYLDFVNEGIRKLSYAASMGTSPDSQIREYENNKGKVIKLLSSFYAVSVREDKTGSAIEKITDGRIVTETTPDPTLLLTPDEWTDILDGSTPIIDGEYIFLYNPYYLPEVYYQADELGKLTGLPIVVSNINSRSIIHSMKYKRILNSGPIEFLNLIRNAKYVIGRSFHLAVFSTIFAKIS